MAKGEWETAGALFRAYFVEGKELNDHEQLVDLASGAGLDVGETRGYLAGEAGVAEMLASQEEAGGSASRGFPSTSSTVATRSRAPSLRRPSGGCSTRSTPGRLRKLCGSHPHRARVYSLRGFDGGGSVREGLLLSRIRDRLSAGSGRLRTNVWPVAQSAAAAALAYFIAQVLLGHERPFFAPIAAVICLSVTLGRRTRRAVELVFGVAVGLLVADLLVLAIGNGTLQIAVVVLLAMAAAVFFGGATILVNQAAVSAILVVVLQPPGAVFSPDRFLDALVGGGVALVVNYLFPINPERLVERAAAPVFGDLIRVLEEIAAALERGDAQGARRALIRSRELDDEVRTFNEALEAGHETARLSPTRRRSLRHLEFYASASIRIELAVINTRVLARGVYNALERGDTIPPQLPAAIRDLARAVRALAAFLEEPGGPEEARRFALEAARGATESLKERHELATSVLVGQVRSAAVDLLRSTGMDQASALKALEEVAGRASEVG